MSPEIAVAIRVDISFSCMKIPIEREAGNRFNTVNGFFLHYLSWRAFFRCVADFRNSASSFDISSFMSRGAIVWFFGVCGKEPDELLPFLCSSLPICHSPFR